MLQFHIEELFIELHIKMDRIITGHKLKSKCQVLTEEKLDEIGANLEHILRKSSDAVHRRPGFYYKKNRCVRLLVFYF
jgi:hypothetical protein